MTGFTRPLLRLSAGTVVAGGRPRPPCSGNRHLSLGHSPSPALSCQHLHRQEGDTEHPQGSQALPHLRTLLTPVPDFLVSRWFKSHLLHKAFPEDSRSQPAFPRHLPFSAHRSHYSIHSSIHIGFLSNKKLSTRWPTAQPKPFIRCGALFRQTSLP